MNKLNLCQEAFSNFLISNFLITNFPYLSVVTKPIIHHTKDECYLSFINGRCCYLQFMPIVEYQEEQRNYFLQNWQLIVNEFPKYTLKFIKYQFIRPTLHEWIHLIYTNQWDNIEDMIDFDLLLDDIFITEMDQMPYKFDESMYGWIYKNYILLVVMNV
jgi:hypothetical protein